MLQHALLACASEPRAATPAGGRVSSACSLPPTAPPLPLPPPPPLQEQVPKEMLVDGGEAVRLPMSPAGLRMALLNAEQYADRNVQRQFKAGKVGGAGAACHEQGAGGRTDGTRGVGLAGEGCAGGRAAPASPAQRVA